MRRGAGLFVALMLVSQVAGCGDDAPATEADPSPARESPTFVAPEEPPEGVTVTDLDAGPVGLATVDDGVWAVLPDAGAVLDPEGGEHPVGDVPLRAVATPDGLWVSVFGASAVVRVDPATGRVDRRVRIRPAGEPEGLAYDGTSVWVVDQENEQVVPLDPATGELGRPVAVGAAPRLVTAGESGVYVGNFDGRSVSRVTPDGADTQPSGDCLTPQGLAEAGGLIWVACTLDGRVVGLDPESLAQEVVLDGLPYADMLVPDGDLVHVVGQQGPTVWTIVTAAREVVGELVLDGAGPTDANVAGTLVDDALVVSHPDAQRLYEVPQSLLVP
jgi:hypothetical protein